MFGLSKKEKLLKAQKEVAALVCATTVEILKVEATSTQRMQAQEIEELNTRLQLISKENDALRVVNKELHTQHTLLRDTLRRYNTCTSVAVTSPDNGDLLVYGSNAAIEAVVAMLQENETLRQSLKDLRASLD